MKTISTTRLEILHHLEYLFKHKKELLELSYPYSSQEFKDKFNANEHLMRHTYCREVLAEETFGDSRGHIISRNDLWQFINDNKDAEEFELDYHEDLDYGAFYTTINAISYGKEKDKDYLERLVEMKDSIDTFIAHREFPERRSSSPDLNRYIEYLEGKLK